MGSQSPLGYSSGIWRQATPKRLPGACLRGRSPRLRSLRRNLICPSAAISVSEVSSLSQPEAHPWLSSAGSSGARGGLSDQPAPLPFAPLPASQQTLQHPRHAAQQDQERRIRQQQQHEAANQLVQRLVPPTPVASATKLPSRGGVSAGGVALGILLTVALQMVGRWLTRHRLGQQLMEILDLRRSSGSSASTSDRRSDGDAADGGSDWSWLTRGRGTQSGSDAGSAEGGAAAAAGTSASSSTSAGSLSGNPAASGKGTGVTAGSAAGAGGARAAGTTALPAPTALTPGESVEWVNMCWRKVWRVYQRGLERWIIDLLQPVFDGLVKDGAVPRWLCRLRVVELTLDHEAPYFSNMRRRNSRKDSDLNGVVDLRYTGGARMLLMLELGEGRWRFKVPVLVSDLDLECQMWLKLRLAPMCPWIGTISLAFVGPPNVKVQLSPYNRVRLMRVPVVQNYLRKLLTVDLPALMVLPERLEINIPPSVTTIAEAAVGRDTIMRAVASAVLQADAVEAALLSALPLGPQTPAGGVSLPEAFKGELSVTLREGRNLPVWGFPGQSNPYCRLVLGDQAVQSRREGDTSHPGRHRAPVWNQEFQFLVEDPAVQVLEMLVKDSHLTGRTEVGRSAIRLTDLLATQHRAEGGKVAMWVPLQPPASPYITGGEAVPTGEVLVELSYKPFDDDEHDSGYREAENYSKQAAVQTPITDIRSAAAASSRAAVAASAAVSAIAMTRAAAARAAARAARAAQEAAAAAAGAAKGAVDQGASIIGGGQQPLGGVLQGGGKGAGADGASGAGAGQESGPGPSSAARGPGGVGAGVGTAAAAPTIDVPKRGHSPKRQQQQRQQQAEQQQQQAPPQAAMGMGSGEKQAPGVIEVLAAAMAAGHDTLNGASDAVYGTGGGKAVLLHLEASAAAPAGLRLPSGMIGEKAATDGGGGGWRLDPQQQGREVLELPLEMNAARVRAGMQGGLEAQVVEGAVAASRGATAGTAAVAAAVIERPAVAVAERVLVAAGGGTGEAVSYSRHGRDGGGGGETVVLSGGSGGGGGSSAWGSSAGGTYSGGGASTGHEDDAATASHPLKEDAVGSSTSSSSSSSLPLLLREALLADSQGHLAGGADGGRRLDGPMVAPRLGQQNKPAARPHSAAAPTQHSAEGSASAEVIDVTVGAMSRREPGGSGGGGSVLSALASLGASAQSLTVSALDKALESLGQKQHQHPQEAPPPPAAEGQAGARPVDGGNWLEALVAKLPRYGGGSDRSHHHHGPDEDEGRLPAGVRNGRAPGFKADRDRGTAAGPAAGAGPGPLSSVGSVDDGQPWWQFWVPKGGAAKLRDASDGEGGGAASPASPPSASAPVEASDGPQAPGGAGAKPWWQFWAGGWEKEAAEGEREAGRSEGARADGGEGEEGVKPVEAIFIPPDLPLEEIAAEVQRLKEDSWRERSDHVSNLWMQAVERNDRKWLMLAAFLLSVAVGLLTVVAWRLEQLEYLQAAAPKIVIMTMQAALQALEHDVSGGGGDLL